MTGDAQRVELLSSVAAGLTRRAERIRDAVDAVTTAAVCHGYGVRVIYRIGGEVEVVEDPSVPFGWIVEERT